MQASLSGPAAGQAGGRRQRRRWDTQPPPQHHQQHMQQQYMPAPAMPFGMPLAGDAVSQQLQSLLQQAAGECLGKA